MRKKIIIIGVIVGVLFLIFLKIKADYSWADKTMRDWKRNGYVVLSSLDNYADIMAPWTLFSTPTTSIWFAKKDQIETSYCYLVIPTVHLQYRYYEGVESSAYYLLYNFISHQDAILMTDSKKSWEDLNWESVTRSENTLIMYRNALKLIGLKAPNLQVEKSK